MVYDRDNIFDVCSRGALRRGGEMYFDRSAAHEFIDACAQHDLAITGIEAFQLTASATRPIPRFNADFTNDLPSDWAPFQRQTVQEGRAFLGEIPPDLFVCFGVMDRQSFDRLKSR